MHDFLNLINPNHPHDFESIYHGMKNQNGWGKKTAALFSKSLFHIHNGQYSDKLKIWDDVPSGISVNEKFYLPVDSVITAIFNEIDKSKSWDFKSINKLIKGNYKGYEIEIWDDLWFWGFITQYGSGDNRILAWNENKYWALKDTDKNPNSIKIINEKAIEFLNLIKFQ